MRALARTHFQERYDRSEALVLHPLGRDAAGIASHWLSFSAGW
jgi:hypothetical protein